MRRSYRNSDPRPPVTTTGKLRRSPLPRTWVNKGKRGPGPRKAPSLILLAAGRVRRCSPLSTNISLQHDNGASRCRGYRGGAKPSPPTPLDPHSFDAVAVHALGGGAHKRVRFAEALACAQEFPEHVTGAHSVLEARLPQALICWVCLVRVARRRRQHLVLIDVLDRGTDRLGCPRKLSIRPEPLHQGIRGCLRECHHPQFLDLGADVTLVDHWHVRVVAGKSFTGERRKLRRPHGFDERD